MAFHSEPCAWMEQILETATLPALLPRASAWVQDTGCSVSDLSEKLAEELADHLHLKRFPRSRFIETIKQAIHHNTLVDDGTGNPCLEVKPDPNAPVLKVEQIDTDPESPSLSPSADTSAVPSSHLGTGALLRPGQRHSNQELCVTHKKWRNRGRLVKLEENYFVCATGHECKCPMHQLSPSLRARSRSPPPRHKRSRTWSSEDISSRIAGFGRYPDKSPRLDREPDGSFSLESVMQFWGHREGLTIERIQEVIQDNLFQSIGRGSPRLRFSVTQGPGQGDPIFIKVAQRSKH